MRTAPTSVELDRIAATLRQQEQCFGAVIAELERSGRTNVGSLEALRTIERNLRQLPGAEA